MFNLSKLVNTAIAKFFADLFENLITEFSEALTNVMGTSLEVLKMPLVDNGLKYAQALAFTLLVLKSMNEAFQTYILYQNGDPDADPTGLLIRTAQAVAIIATLPWIVKQIFEFGTKVSSDVSHLGTGKIGIDNWTSSLALIERGGVAIAIISTIMIICILVVAIQAAIRGAELSLMCILGPILALNITANNRNVWSAWFKQLIIICTSQALQIFMLEGAFSLIAKNILNGTGLLMVIGWLWVTIKTPKFVQQFAYSTGFTGAVGGTTKQVGIMHLTRKMFA